MQRSIATTDLDGRHRRGAAVERARRHSRRVRRLKIALPALAALTLIAMFAPQFVPRLSVGPLQFAGLSIDGEGVAMQSPTISGYDSNDTRYEIAAIRAIREHGSSRIRLEEIEGVLIQADGRRTRIEARSGLVDTDAKTLRLDGRVLVIGDDGFQALLRSADVWMSEGRMISEEPVEVSVIGGIVTADRLAVEERGKRIRFDGAVRVEIEMAGDPLPMPAAGAPR